MRLCARMSLYLLNKQSEGATMKRKICIVGGVAGGATIAAKLRRLNEVDEIILFGKDVDVWSRVYKNRLAVFSEGKGTGGYARNVRNGHKKAGFYFA